MNRDIAGIRREYGLKDLVETQADSDPIRQFHLWLEQAIEAQLPDANAMTLSTVNLAGKPSSRIVLLKGYDRRGLVFYTNYQSRKSQELEANPWAALNFWWIPLERQIRLEGRAEKLDPAESEAYFHSRPRDSQLGAWTSPQSSVILDREVLEQKFKELEGKYTGVDVIPRPEYWGGWRVIPETIEFWQGRASRLHDRLLYQLQPDGSWQYDRLAP